MDEAEEASPKRERRLRNAIKVNAGQNARPSRDEAYVDAQAIAKDLGVHPKRADEIFAEVWGKT